MSICVARHADLEPWLALAAEVEPLFGPMVRDPAFRRALSRNITRGSAYCIRKDDLPPGAPLAAGLLFSARPPVYRIGWLAVAASCRRCGLGSALVEHAMALVPFSSELIVITFGPDVPGGESARRFYESLGFVPAEMSDPSPTGAPRQVFRLPTASRSFEVPLARDEAVCTSAEGPHPRA